MGLVHHTRVLRIWAPSPRGGEASEVGGALGRPVGLGAAKVTPTWSLEEVLPGQGPGLSWGLGGVGRGRVWHSSGLSPSPGRHRPPHRVCRPGSSLLSADEPLGGESTSRRSERRKRSPEGGSAEQRPSAGPWPRLSSTSDPSLESLGPAVQDSGRESWGFTL